MSGKQQLVGAAGFGLLAVSFWTSPARAQVGTGLFGASSTSAQRTQAHTDLVQYAGALAAVAVATLLSGASDNLATAFLAIIAALFLLWAITHFGATGTNSSAQSTTTGKTVFA